MVTELPTVERDGQGIAIELSVAAPRESSTKAGRREWIGLVVIALPCLLYSMDLTVLDLAIPRLSAELRPTSAQLLWIVDIYGFVLAGMLIPMGTLGDRIGRRRLLMMGAAAFGVASVLAAFATSAAMLIAARAVLGVAGATLAPSTLSLIRNMFLDAEQRTTAIGVWITSYSVGGAVGPLIGGLLLEHFWWGSVFLIGVPVMVLLLAVAPTLLPEFRDPNARRIDVPSAALSLGAVLGVIYGVKQLALANTHNPLVAVVSIVVGLALAAAFVRRQQTLPDPMLDLGQLRHPAFSGALFAYTLATFVSFGMFLFVGQYLQVVLRLSPFRAGVATLPVFGGFIAGSIISRTLTTRLRPHLVMIGGLLLSTIGFAVIGLVGPATHVIVIAAGAGIYALGLSPVIMLATDLIVGSAPPERAGAAAALSETGSELGGALGVAVLGSVGTAVYRGVIARDLPSGVSDVALEAVRNTVGGAVAVAAQLPAGVGNRVRDVAAQAFTRSMNVTAWVCVAIALLIAAGLAETSRRPPIGVD